MKQVNFSHPGGFPLEQETLERLQTAYRSELYEAFKSHLGLKTDTNYLIAHATDKSKGWVVIHQEEEDAAGETKLQGILYPINNYPVDDYLRTTRTRTNLIFGAGTSQTAYYDYDAEYINQSDYNNETIENVEDGKVRIYNFYNLKDFSTVPDIDTLSKTYLPLDGSKAMEGDLDLGEYRLSRLDTKENYDASVRATDFNFGSANRRGLQYPGDYLGRALVDNSDQNRTDLTLNYDSDWENTTIGGKVHLNDLNTNTTDFTTSASSANSLLLIDDAKQVTKSSNLLNSLLSRITKLETEKSSAIPIGMIALWGKPAPFPEGWEEYVPLRGRMPIGFNPNDVLFNSISNYGGDKNKKLLIEELPPHYHHKKDSPFKSFVAQASEYGHDSSSNAKFDNVDSDTEIAIGNLGNNYKLNGDALEQTIGNGQSFSILNPYQVVHFIQYTGVSTPPITTPDPDLYATNILNSSFTLNWKALNSQFEPTNYLVYKDNAQIASLGNVRSYKVSGLTPGTNYSFYVVAKDSTGNLTFISIAITVTTTNTVVPKPAYIDAFLTSERNINVEWDFDNRYGPSSSYELWRRTNNGTSMLVSTTSAFSYQDTSTNYATAYHYKVRGIDENGNTSDFTSEIVVTTDPSPPTCFDIESPVTMATGHSKKLKNVVVGDKLQGFAFPNEIDESDGDYMLWNGLLNEATKTEVTVVAKRTSTQAAYYEIKTVDNTLKVTAEHPLLITQDGENVKWLRVKDISENMSLIDKSGNPKPIESIVFKEEPLEVAVLDVETVDNYIISGIVAHNKEVEPFYPEEPF